MACKICGGDAPYRKRLCEPCRNAPKVCDVCQTEKPSEKFNHCATCNECRYALNSEKHRAAARKHHYSLQAKVFEAYGSVCACCGESRRTMLNVDHINNDGAEHRRQLSMNSGSHRWRNANIGGTNVYRDLVNRGFPQGFQLLCSNCNASKARNGGVCEHITERATTIPQGSTLQVSNGSGSARPPLG